MSRETTVAEDAAWAAKKIELMSRPSKADPKHIRVSEESPYARHIRFQKEIVLMRERSAVHGVMLSWAECKMKLGSEVFFCLLGLSLKKGELVR